MLGLRITLALAMVVGLAGAVCADIIHLKNGNRLEVRISPAEPPTDAVGPRRGGGPTVSGAE